MVQFLSIIFFLVFLQFLLGFSKVPVFLCHSVYVLKLYSYLVGLHTRAIQHPEEINPYLWLR